MATEDTIHESNISYCSSPINSLELRGPETCLANFVYNYYIPDECINDNGYVEKGLGLVSMAGGGGGAYRLRTRNEFAQGMSEVGGAVDHAVREFQYRVQQQVPRYVQISIEGLAIASIPGLAGALDQEESLKLTTDAMTLIADNLSVLHDDSAVSTGAATPKFLTLSLQDNDMNKEIGHELLYVQDLRSENRTNILNQLGNVARAGAKRYSTNVVPTSIFEDWADALEKQSEDMMKYHYNFGVGGMHQSAGETPSEDMVAQNITLQINPIIYSDLLSRAVANAVNSFSHDLAADVAQAQAVTKLARQKQLTFDLPDANDYDVLISPLTQTQFQSISLDDFEDQNVPASLAVHSILQVGHIIEKFEVLGDARRLRHTPIVVGSVDARTIIDTKVKVGTTYHYQARSVYLLRLVTYDEDTTEHLSYALFSSKPTAGSVIYTKPHDRPPCPPGDIKFIYDYDVNNLSIYWSFPVEPQRDVRYFQIYRRSSFVEPFQLIREYDFNDAARRFERGELVRPELIERHDPKSPRTFYIDNDFNRDSSFIYALVSIDAHDQISNYSTQFRVSFDRFVNKLVVEEISVSGAPRTYPNYFLSPQENGIRQETILTDDAIKVSNHRDFSIYFNPDALWISKPDPGSADGKQDTNHVVFAYQKPAENQDPAPESTSPSPKYTMQIINVDNGKSRNLDISINNQIPVPQPPPSPEDPYNPHVEDDELSLSSVDGWLG